MEGGFNKSRLDVILEKISPLLAYVLIIFPIVMSFINIQIAILYLVFIYVYFVYKSAAVCIQFAISLFRIRQAEQIHWMELLDGLRDIPKEIEKLKSAKEEIKKYKWGNYKYDLKKIYSKLELKNNYQSANSRLPKFLQRILFKRLRRKTINFINEELEALDSLKDMQLVNFEELQHIIIIPHVKEPVSILRETLEHLKKQTFSTKQINVVLAAEAADPNGVAVSEQLKQEYKNVFNNIWITNHVLSEGEIVGKSANMNWAGRQVYKEVKKLGWDLKKTTITSCDADSKIDPNYFAYMSYKYVTTENREYKYYTSAMIFYNNIWRLPFYARVKNSMHSIMNAANLARPDKLVPFSTYTSSFWLIEQIGFWDPWITPEDYHLFFKGLFKFDKYVSTVPVFLKTMSDAAEGEGHWSTIKNNYFQSRRWAWGVSDGGWMLKNFIKNFSKSTLRAKYVTTHTLFDHVMGLSIAFLVLLGASIPGIINPEFRGQTAGVLFPIVSGRLVTITLLFLLILILLDFLLRPRPEKDSWPKRILQVLEFIVQPVAGFFLTALPGLEAQTRLVFGKYLEYYVTKKKGAEENEKVVK